MSLEEAGHFLQNELCWRHASLLSFTYNYSIIPEPRQSRAQPLSFLAQVTSFAMPSHDARAHLRQAIRPLERPAGYISRALTAAWYPLEGIWYFLRHPAYYPLFLGRLLPLSLISILVYTILFTFAFLPQYAFLAIFHGWGAWVNAVFLTLGEGLVIIQGLFEGFFVDECRVDVFDVCCSTKQDKISRAANNANYATGHAH